MELCNSVISNSDFVSKLVCTVKTYERLCMHLSYVTIDMTLVHSTLENS
jgi:hypothetical protein